MAAFQFLKPKTSDPDQTMKKSVLASLTVILAAGLLAGCVSEKCEMQHKEAKQARLMGPSQGQPGRRREDRTGQSARWHDQGRRTGKGKRHIDLVV
jgi:hypothetical protein